jgi:hypothetical protein
MARKCRMNHRLFLFLLIAAVMISTGAVSAQTRSAAIGDIVPLSGTAIGRDFMYLFMTGPGVPSGGSRMDSSISPVVTGNPNTFTQVQVIDDQWSYQWNTGRVSGGLAAGEYTIYAATQPVSKDALGGVPYSSLDITLYRPVTTGDILVRSSPLGGEVTVNGKYSGNTPLDLTSLPPGPYHIEIALAGYHPANETVNLLAGDQKVFTVTLVPVTPETTVTSLPFTVTPLSTDFPPPSPTRAGIPVLLALFGLFLSLCFRAFRR